MRYVTHLVSCDEICDQRGLVNLLGNPQLQRPCFHIPAILVLHDDLRRLRTRSDQ